MKKGLLLICSMLVVIALLLASCGEKPSTTTPTTTPTTTATTTQTTTAPPTTKTATPTTQPTTKELQSQQRPGTENWASKKDVPQYGGTLTWIENLDITRTLDPGSMGFASAHMIGGTVVESLAVGNWAKGPGGSNEFAFQGYYIPSPMLTGDLAESWEVSPDGLTYTVHLRKGVHFQNRPPVNGRELTADDVKYCWDRKLGTGSGFTKMTAYFVEGMDEIESITAKDKYTVVFKAKRFSYLVLDFVLVGYYMNIYPREVIDKYGNMDDWHNVVGTGPFMLTDYVANSSATLTKNPDYYRYDELHPENRLPYIDEIKKLVIVDQSTQFAAIRSYKADFYSYRGAFLRDKLALEKEMPQLQFCRGGSGKGFAVYPKWSVAPFDNLKVRQALMYAVDRVEMATIINGIPDESYASWMNADFGEPGGFIPFEKLPQDVKDLYTYNPEKAKQLLKEAGYPDGFSVDIWQNKDEDFSHIEILKNHWAKVGVKLNIVLKDSTTIQNAHSNNGYPGFIGSEIGAVSVVTHFRSLEIKINGPGGWNTAEGKKAMQMWDDTCATVEEAARVAKMKELNIYLLRNVVGIPLILQPVPYDVVQPWVGGWYNMYQLRKHEPGTVVMRVWIDAAKKRAVTKK